MQDKYVLLVEDNEDDVTLTKMAFKKAQVSSKLKIVSNGQDALDFLYCHGRYADRTPGENPALILLDLKLPFVSGLDVLKEIRANPMTRQIPVLVLTSSIEEKDRLDAGRLGANDFICKPTSYSSFIDVIGQIRTQWQL